MFWNSTSQSTDSICDKLTLASADHSFFLLDPERKDESGKYSGDCQSGISDSVCVADSDTFCSGRKDYRVFCSGSGTDRDRHYYTDDSK